MRRRIAIVQIRAWLLIAGLSWLCVAFAGVQLSGMSAMADNHPMQAAQSARPPTWGEHGMVLFGGRDGLFASHLPMFHAPHDYHVVIALQIESPAVDAAMRERLAKTPQLWTLVPEEFELARLAPGSPHPLTEFKADLVEGHFERGGKTIYPGVMVRVIRTERFVQLDPAARTTRTARYEPIGQGSTWFLVKEVRARPDFDHVVMLSTPHAPKPIDVPIVGIAHPADDAIAAMLPARTRVVGTVYYDTQDMQ